MSYTFDRQSVQRIQRAVLAVEKWPQTRQPPAPLARAGRFSMPQVCLAAEDIEHDSFGSVILGEGSAFDSLLTATGRTVGNVYNPGPKVWSGSRVSIENWALRLADRRRLCIQHAWSATRITGTAAANISPGGTGTLNSVSPLDGHFGPSSVSAYLSSGAEQVDSGTVVEANLAYRESTSSSRWEIYSTKATTPSTSFPPIMGFNDVVQMTGLTFSEDRTATWDAVNLVGSISGVTWDVTEEAFTMPAGDWYFTYGLAGHNACGGDPLPTRDTKQYLYAKLETRIRDAGPPPTWLSWTAVPSSTLHVYMHFGGYWNSSSRGYLIRTADEQQFRMKVGAGQASSAACTEVEVYDGHWFLTKVNIG